MSKLKDDNGKALPPKVQKRVDDFISHLKDVHWFNPSSDLKKEDIEKQVKFTLDCFGLKAKIEYRKLEKKEDWDSARDSAWASARDSAWASARASARDSAWASARASAWASARDSARDSAWAWASDSDSAWDSDSDSDSAWDSAWASDWASAEVLLEDNKEFKKKYPNGAFKQLFKIWEMGLYPVGILKNKKFVIYVPPCKLDLPKFIN